MLIRRNLGQLVFPQPLLSCFASFVDAGALVIHLIAMHDREFPCLILIADNER